MEREALNLISEGVIFLTLDDGIIKEYYNLAAVNILGNKIATDDKSWVEIFDAPEQFIATVKQCVTQNIKLNKIFKLRLETQLLPLTFTPTNSKQVIVIIHSLGIDNLHQFVSNIEGFSAAIVQYYPDLKDFKYLSVSKTTLERIKKTSTEIIGKFALKDNLVSQQVISQLVPHIQTLTSKFQKLEIELKVGKPTFEQPKIFAMHLQLLDRSTDLPILFCHNVDLTELREAEEGLENERKCLEEMENNLRILSRTFEYSQLPIGTSELLEGEKDLKLLFANNAARMAMNIPFEEDLSKISIWNQIPAPLAEELVGRLKQCWESKQPIQYEVTVGDTTLSVYLFQVEERKFSYFTIDITERKKLEVELKQHKEQLEELISERTKKLQDALTVKGRFLATMSHELRTPIAGIAGALNLLADTPLNAEQTELVEITNVATQQLLTVINDILDLTKLEANKMEIEEIEMNLNECLEKAVEVVSFEAEKKKLDIICDIDTSVPSHIIGDPNRVRQILINLLTNAIKFSFKGSILVSACLSKENEEIHFCVQDQGIGIPPEALEKLFQPFTQADSSTSRKYGGSGLGLSICKKLVERMGGRIWIESVVGKGSAFHFNVLVKKGKLDEKEQLQDLNGKTAFIIEENELFRETLSNVLKRFMNCYASSNIQDIQDKKIDFILIDGSFPKEEILKLQNQAPVAVIGFSNELETWKEVPNIISIRKPIKLFKLLSFFRNSIFHPKKISTSRQKATLKILVAEDNKLNQQIARKMLNSLGFENLEIVENGRLAVNAAEVGNFDIIFMDIMMPEMGGIEATKLIRKANIQKPVIVALTADVFVQQSDGEEEKALFDELMLKPINKKKLESFLEKYNHNGK